MDRAEPEGWERGRGSARAGCSWTITLRWRLRLAMARGTNGAALARAEGEHGGISSCRAGSVADCCAVRDGDELEHVPRGLASGANVKPAADRRRRGREPRVDWLCTFNRRKWWEKPNVGFSVRSHAEPGRRLQPVVVCSDAAMGGTVSQARLPDHHAANETRKFHETQRGPRKSQIHPNFAQFSSTLGTTQMLNNISRKSGPGQNPARDEGQIVRGGSRRCAGLVGRGDARAGRG